MHVGPDQLVIMVVIYGAFEIRPPFRNWGEPHPCRITTHIYDSSDGHGMSTTVGDREVVLP